MEKFTEAASLILSLSTSTIIGRKIAVRATNTTDSLYSVSKDTRIADFSAVTPEQSKFINLVDTALLSMMPEDDPYLNTYLTELLRTNNTDQQRNTFGFPTPENYGNIDDHTPIQTPFLKELREQQQKKLNPKDDVKSRMEFLKQFDWTYTLLTKSEEQAMEDILVEYHDMFAGHRMDTGINTEFKVKLTAKDDRAVYSQNLTMLIHLKEDLNVELAPMHKYGIVRVLPFSKYSSPIFEQRKPNEKLRLLVDHRKINTLIADDYTNDNHQSALFQMQHNTWQGSHYSVSLIAAKRITACRWRTNVRWKCLHSILPAEPLPTEDLQKVSADLCLLFQASCAITWTQLSRLTNVLNTLMILELQPTMLRILTGTFAQSSSVFAEQDWNWQLKMPLWSRTSWIPTQNYFSWSGITTNSKNSKFLKQIEIPQIEKGFAEPSGVLKLLKKRDSRVG